MDRYDGVEVKRVPEGQSGLPVRKEFKPRRGNRRTIFDPEICRNIGVALLAKASDPKLIGDGITPGLFSTIIRRALINQLEFYMASKRARKTTEGDKEVGYDDVPGMNNLVYSGSEDEGND